MKLTKLEPPYFAVIFTSIRTDGDQGYNEIAARMLELASRQPGFLGVESARDAELGITVSYWQDLNSIEHWRTQAEHQEAQRMGRDKWYKAYQVRVAKVEKSYGFPA